MLPKKPEKERMKISNVSELWQGQTCTKRDFDLECSDFSVFFIMTLASIWDTIPIAGYCGGRAEG